ncbi:MAG: PucR family transcriptional regulator [Solirubrobacterales bacterium]
MFDPDETTPWSSLPRELAEILRPELDELSGSILVAIGAEVSEYARPLEGEFGRGLRGGVAAALGEFIELIGSPTSDRAPTNPIYSALGAGEMRRGRSLDALQAAYRVGARLAWRRFSEVGSREGVEPEVMFALAEAIFSYIEGIASESVEGYAREQALHEGAREQRSRQLLQVLTSGTASAGELATAGAEAGWPIPASVAALVCDADGFARVLSRMPPGCAGAVIDGRGVIAVSDPSGPGRREALARALESRGAALGPGIDPSEFHASWLDATTASAALEPEELIETEDHLLDLILAENEGRLRRVLRRRLAPLEELTPNARARTVETLRAYLSSRGEVRVMADELHLHPQTVRYRVERLRELIGPTLAEPQSRLELEAALGAVQDWDSVI